MAKKSVSTEAPSKTSDVPIEQAILAAEFVEIEHLIPYANNARTHSDAQVAQLAAAIAEFGWTNPVLCDAFGIVAGHGRVLAARKLYGAGQTIKLPNGLEIPTGTVPVLRCDGWDATKRRAYVLADNQLALNAGWDEDLLKIEIAALQGSDFNFDLLGFDAGFVDQLMGTVVHFGKTDPDDVPETPAAPVTRLGDVWLLGKHRIICGDSTDKETVERVLAGAKPHLMVTDPPYGVEYDANWRNEAARNSEGMGNRALGAGAVGKVLNDDRADWSEAWVLFKGDVAYVWHAGLFAGVVAESLQSQGLHLRSQIIWAKQQFAIGRGDYHWKHEPCWYVVRKGAQGHYNGDRTQSTLWEIDKPQKSETGHSTQKPVECMRRPIENNSKIGDGVYEPFSGSGTTLIAAQMMDRVCYAIELNPIYCDVAIQRWQNFTGEKAMLETQGKSFEDVAAERVGDKVSEEVRPVRKAKAKS